MDFRAEAMNHSLSNHNCTRNLFFSARTMKEINSFCVADPAKLSQIAQDIMNKRHLESYEALLLIVS